MVEKSPKSKPKQKQMDETLEDTFPASDPPSWSMPRADHDLNLQKKETKARPDNVDKNFTKNDYLDKTDAA